MRAHRRSLPMFTEHAAGQIGTARPENSEYKLCLLCIFYSDSLFFKDFYIVYFRDFPASG